MAADQERNERIAKALGLRLSDEPMEWVDMVCVVQQRFTRCWVDSTGKIQACGEELPDFSTPEWQIKIQDRVEELCGENYDLKYAYYKRKGVKYWSIKVCAATYDNPLAFCSAITKRSTYKEALLWLAERKVKNESNG